MKILWKIRPEHATIWKNACLVMKNSFDVEKFVDRRDCVAGITQYFQDGVEGKSLDKEAGRKASVRLLDTLILAAKTNAGVLKSLGGFSADTRSQVEQFFPADLIARICGNFRLMFCDLLERSGITDLPEDLLGTLDRRIRDEFDDFLLRAPFDGSDPQSYWQPYFNGTPRVVFQNALNDKLQAVTDAGTGLYNRRYGHERLQRELDIARNTGQMLTFSIIDIDHFKKINDDHDSHGVGDQILYQVAQLLRESLRLTDVIFRLGGEEFAVILPNTDAAGALEVLEKIRSTVENAKFQYQNGSEEKELQLTVTCGIHFLQDDDDLRSLEDRADFAMYGGKRKGGRNCIGVYCGSDSLDCCQVQMYREGVDLGVHSVAFSQNGDSPSEHLSN